MYWSYMKKIVGGLVIIPTGIEFIVIFIASLFISSVYTANTFAQICATVACFPLFISVAFNLRPQMLNLIIATCAGMSYLS